MAPSWTQRRKIMEDTLSRVETILHEVREGSLESTFVSKQLPILLPIPETERTSAVVRVVNCDSFTLAREIMNRTEAAKGRTAVLNLASDLYRAGGWTETLSVTQEEALCYSSTLYHTLKEEYYPWPNMGPASTAGVYSPAVVVFKDDLDHNCEDLPANERRTVAILTVAAPRSPPLSLDGETLRWEKDLDCFREKIRLVYRMAAHNGKDHVVLGAMGCGAYECPPRQVAEEMKAILLEEEFRGRFREVAFAVYSTPRNRNYEIFKEVLDGVEV